MKQTTTPIKLSLLFVMPLLLLNQGFSKTSLDSLERINSILDRPLIERYILDELKQLRMDQADLKKETIEKIAEAELSSADRAISYTTDMTTNIFYIITIAASILVILGWRSLSDIKRRVESITEEKIDKVTTDYEARLTLLEKDLKEKSVELIKTQEKLTITNQVQSLWRRASIEDKSEEKIHIYDQILEISPENVDAMTYKATSLLDIGEVRWAYSLASQAMEIDPNYYLAYWQRACANAKLGKSFEAIQDIEKSIKLSDLTKEEILAEPMFESLNTDPRFNRLLQKLP